MNKLQGEVRINIGGKSRLFKFGTNATAVFCQTRNIRLNEVQNALSPQNMDIESVRDFIYSGLVAGCYTEKINVEFDRYEVGDWIDDMPQEELNKAFGVVDVKHSGSNLTKKKTKRK